MVRYFLLSLLFCTNIFALLAEIVCSSSSIECSDTRSEYATDYFCSSSANLFCYILNDNTQLIKSQLKNCSSSSNSFTQICLFKGITGNVIIDLDLPENIVRLSFINTLDGSAFGITTSVTNYFLTSLLFRGDVNIENENIFKFFVNLRSLYARGDIFSNEILSFTNLHSLRYIQSGFQVSGTTKLDGSMVSGLENLVALYIRNSNFHEIKLNAFQNLINLRDLAINNNRALTQIQNGTFDSLTKLTRLHLISTSIRPVGNSLLKPLNQLEDLSLYDSQNFPLEGLIYLRGLKRLSLGYGSSSTLDPFLFQQLNSLTYLSLFYNPIVCNCNLEWIPKLAQKGVAIVGTCSFPISARGSSFTDSSLYTNCPQTDSYKCFNRYITCPNNEFCHNTGDDYNCSCIPGYVRLNTGECIEYNECSRPNQCEYSCTNTDGSFYCNCNEGFQISTNGYSCEDINECQFANGGCEVRCENTVGSYYCNCSEGFQISANGYSCNDINECQFANGGCEVRCENTIGSYYCNCSEGFQISANGYSCNDINECQFANGGCEGICENTVGSYYCNCSEGFQISANGYNCEDVNECQAANGGCEGICENTVGSYYCNCSEGYKISANGLTCEDVNECQTADGGCEGGCKNTVGSFKCYCEFGYTIYDETSCSVTNEFEILKISIAGVVPIGITVAGVIFGTLIVYIIALKMKMTKLKEKERNYEESTYEEIGPYGGMQMQINLRNDPNQSKLNNPLFEIHSNPTATQEETKQSDTKTTESEHNLERKIHIDNEKGKFNDYYEQVEMKYSSLPVPHETISNEEHAKPSDIAATEVRHSNSQIEISVNGDNEKMDNHYEQVGADYISLPAPYETISNEEQTKRSDFAATEVGPNLRSELFIGGDKVKMGKLYEQVDPEYSSLPTAYEAISNEEQTKHSEIAETGVGHDSQSETFVDSDKEKMGKLYEQVDPEYSNLPGLIPET